MRDNISMIFVSHSMNSVRLFCDNVLVLEKGKKAFLGKADDGIKYYLEQEEKKKEELKKKETKKDIKPFYGDTFHNEDKIVDVMHQWNKEFYELEEEMVLEFSFKLKYKPKNLIIGIPVWTNDGDFITAFNTDYYKIELISENNIYKGKLICKCSFNPPFTYTSMIAIVDGSEYLYRNLNNQFGIKLKERVFGYVTISHEWRINEKNS